MDIQLIQKSLFCLAAGAAIGSFHFGGLWFTVKRAFDGQFRWPMFLAGFVFRSLVTLAAIFLVTNGQWMRLTFCLAGLLIARQFFTARIGRRKAIPEKEATHELHGH